MHTQGKVLNCTRIEETERAERERGRERVKEEKRLFPSHMSTALYGHTVLQLG